MTEGITQLIALLKEARKIIKAHRRTDLQHNDFLQRSQDAINKAEKQQDTEVDSLRSKVATLEHQLRAAKTVIEGADRRAIESGRELEALSSMAADVESERAANARLTAEVAALGATEKRLREALTLAANRMGVLALDYAYGTTRRDVVDDWAKEARAAIGGRS